jgi:hypothetical protein
MRIYDRELPTDDHSLEAAAVQSVFELDFSEFSAEDSSQYQHVVAIVRLFTQYDPETRQPTILSPSRIAAIPAISARHAQLMRSARGELTRFQIENAWWDNFPHDREFRHPDLLFDIAQYNFGTDAPIDNILRAMAEAEKRRARIMERCRHLVHSTFARYYLRDVPEDLSEELTEILAKDVDPISS